MTIIVFVVDNSTSMGQKFYQGISLLDIAKSFITDMLKVRGIKSNYRERGVFNKILVITFLATFSCLAWS